MRRQSGGSSIQLAILLLSYGQVKSDDSVDEALGILGEARTILERNRDKRASSAATAMAIVAINEDRYADARKYSEDALAHLDADADPQQVAFTKFMHARALAETRGDRATSRKLAIEARELFAKLGPGAAGSVKNVDAWLASHRQVDLHR